MTTIGRAWDGSAMCRSDVTAAAVGPLAALLADLRDALARDAGADPADVLIGPVDFGPSPE